MNGSGTRSSLMYETVRIVDKLKPKYVIWENVKNLLSKKHRHNFDNYLNKMSELGYRNYYQVLNAKDYGIPQNRERVFTISIRADIEKEFHFPEKQELKLRLKDMLEDQVDEKYYLSDKIIKFYKKNEEEQKAKGNGFTFGVSDGNKVARAITTRAGSRMDDNFIQQIGKLDIKGHDSVKRVYSDNGISPTLTDMQGGNRQPKIAVDNPLKGKTDMSWQFEQQVFSEDGITRAIKANGGSGNIPKLLIKNNTQQGYAEAYEGDSINLEYPNSLTRRGRVGHEVSQTLQTSASMGIVVKEINKNAKHQQDLVQNGEDVCRTIPAGTHGSTPHLLKTIVEKPQQDGLRIRKLTPKECWRLMGFHDDEFEKAEKVNSNTQLYKQAGNSIVVNVLEKILKNLLEN